jgi:WD40 repeat protein
MFGSMAFAPDGRILALLQGRHRIVKLISVPDGKELATLDTGMPLCFSPDGGQLVTAGEDHRSLLVWDLRLIRQELRAMKLDWE